MGLPAQGSVTVEMARDLPGAIPTGSWARKRQRAAGRAGQASAATGLRMGSLQPRQGDFWAPDT